MKYPEDSAGSIMNMEFLALKKDMTVEDAFKRIRRIGGDNGDHQHPATSPIPPATCWGVLSVRDPAAGGGG